MLAMFSPFILGGSCNEFAWLDKFTKLYTSDSGTYLCKCYSSKNFFLNISKGGQAGTCLYRFPGSHIQSFSGGPPRKGTASSPFLDVPTL